MSSHDAPAGIGDNSAKFNIPSVEEIEASLLIENEAALARTDALIKKGEEFLVITTDEQEKQATEFMLKVRARWKDTETARTAQKAFYDDRASAVHAFYKSRILDPLGLAPEKKNAEFDPVKRTDLGMGPRINMALTVYKVAKLKKELADRAAAAAAAKKLEDEAEERRRKLAEEADELARKAARARNPDRIAELSEKAEAAADAAEVATVEANDASVSRADAVAEATAPAADMTRARGGRGGVSSLRTVVNFRDIDREKLGHWDDSNPEAAIVKLLPYFTDAAMEAAVRGWIAANKAAAKAACAAGAKQPINGVILYEGYGNSTRA